MGGGLVRQGILPDVRRIVSKFAFVTLLNFWLSDINIAWLPGAPGNFDRRASARTEGPQERVAQRGIPCIRFSPEAAEARIAKCNILPQDALNLRRLR